MNDIVATKINNIHITVPCMNQDECKTDIHLYGSCGELHDRVEKRVSHCPPNEEINIIIDKSTRRPFFNIKQENTLLREENINLKLQLSNIEKKTDSKTKRQNTKLSLKRYHESKLGREALKRASVLYYQRHRQSILRIKREAYNKKKLLNLEVTME
jgi:hypothetical protein